VRYMYASVQNIFRRKIILLPARSQQMTFSIEFRDFLT
jgi:hypothetical protein